MKTHFITCELYIWSVMMINSASAVHLLSLCFLICFNFYTEYFFLYACHVLYWQTWRAPISVKPLFLILSIRHFLFIQILLCWLLIVKRGSPMSSWRDIFIPLSFAEQNRRLHAGQTLVDSITGISSDMEMLPSPEWCEP